MPHSNAGASPFCVRNAIPLLAVAVKDRCKLYCRVAGTTSFYQLKDRVADGTPCGTETNDLCVQGLCRVSRLGFLLENHAFLFLL